MRLCYCLNNCVLYLHDGFCVLQQPANQSVAWLMEGHHPLLLFGQDLAFLHTACISHTTNIKTIQQTCSWERQQWLEDALLPAITLSTAYSKLKLSMDLYPSRAAWRAASLQMFAISAPGTKKTQMWRRSQIIARFLKNYETERENNQALDNVS